MTRLLFPWSKFETLRSAIRRSISFTAAGNCPRLTWEFWGFWGFWGLWERAEVSLSSYSRLRIARFFVRGIVSSAFSNLLAWDVNLSAKSSFTNILSCRKNSSSKSSSARARSNSFLFRSLWLEFFLNYWNV